MKNKKMLIVLGILASFIFLAVLICIATAAFILNYTDDSTQSTSKNNNQNSDTVIEKENVTQVVNGYTFEFNNYYDSEELGLRIYYPDDYEVSDYINDNNNPYYVSSLIFKKDNADYFDGVRITEITPDRLENYNFVNYTKDQIPQINVLNQEYAAPLIELFGEGFPCWDDRGEPIGDLGSAGGYYTYYYNLGKDLYISHRLEFSQNQCPGEEYNADKDINTIVSENINSKDFAEELAIIQSIKLLEN